MSPLTLYPALALVAALAMGGFYKYGYHNGWGDRDKDMQLEIAAKNEEARQKEQLVAKAMADKDAQLRKANDVVNEKQTNLDRAIRAGRVRLPGASCSQAAASPAPASGDWNQATSQPDRPADAASDSERETLRLIAQIAADGDRAINQLNACIDAYEEMRTVLNGNP